MICPKCKGSGHDKKSRPEVETKTINIGNGRTKTKYVTKALGSGCLRCGGIGTVEE